jgi:hypothetical protein
MRFIVPEDGCDVELFVPPPPHAISKSDKDSAAHKKEMVDRFMSDSSSFGSSRLPCPEVKFL